MFFLGFFKCLNFYENRYKLFSLKQIFYQQTIHKLSFIYKKISKVYALNEEYFRKK
jgi:hypothetical protein